MSENGDAVFHGGDFDDLLAQIVRHSDDAILTKTLGGVVQSWNRSAERIFGYCEEEMVGSHISRLIPIDRLAEEADIIARLRAGTAVDHFETVRRHKDGTEIDVSISVSPIRDRDGNVAGASKILRDIRERKRAEARAQLLQAELAHVARLYAMGQMSSAIAHELNQPLTAINNYMGAARRTLQAGGGEAIAPALQMIDKAANQILRAGAILKSLRGFVEKRESRRGLEDINSVVEEAVSLGLTGAAHENVSVALDLDRTLAPVMIDRVQIQQVLINLIRNAYEAMQAVRRRELTITTAALPDGFAQVTVRDTGPGLAPDVRRRLFLPFVTTKESGMGIGLNICQSIIESHGGSIGALADVAGGAAFRFNVPLARRIEAAQ
jgi:two-component system sensor kinase FixL